MTFESLVLQKLPIGIFVDMLFAKKDDIYIYIYKDAYCLKKKQVGVSFAGVPEHKLSFSFSHKQDVDHRVYYRSSEPF